MTHRRPLLRAGSGLAPWLLAISLLGVGYARRDGGLADWLWLGAPLLAVLIGDPIHPRTVRRWVARLPFPLTLLLAVNASLRDVSLVWTGGAVAAALLAWDLARFRMRLTLVETVDDRDILNRQRRLSWLAVLFISAALMGVGSLVELRLDVVSTLLLSAGLFAVLALLLRRLRLENAHHE